MLPRVRSFSSFEASPDKAAADEVEEAHLVHKLFWLRVVPDLPTPFELALLSAICRNDATMKPLWFTNMRFICKCRAIMQNL